MSNPPSLDYERLLANTWSELLAVPHVSPGDDFFALGGHSLMAADVVTRLAGVLEIDDDEAFVAVFLALFEFSRLEEFAEFLRSRAWETASSQQHLNPDLPTS